MDRIDPSPAVSMRRPINWNAPLVMIGLLMVLLLPWAMHEWLIKALNHDILWLLTVLERILSGRAMVDAAYETNPPLSFFIYLPVYFLSTLGVSIELSLLVSIFVGVLLSAFAVYYLLSCYLDLDTIFASGLCGVYIIGLTSFAVPEYGQRDHIITLGLVPLLLVQLALVQDVVRPKQSLLIWFICFFCAVLILLKPHYGIIPAVMIAVRFFRGRGLKVLRDPDVIALGIMAALYVVSLALFFPDYLGNILPVVLELYGAFGGGVSMEILVVFSLLNGVLLAAGYSLGQGRIRSLLMLFSVASIVALVPYVLMQKGFAYHLVPAAVFLFLAIGIIIQQALRSYVRAVIAMVVTILLMAAGAMFLPHTYYPTQEEVLLAPITRALTYDPETKQKCDGECRFMILGVSIRATQLSSHYAGGEQGSRFATLWFVPGLVKEEALLLHSDDVEKKSDHANMRADFIAMLRQDIVNWRPDRLLFCNEMQDLAYLGADTILKSSEQDYRMVKTISVNRGQFFAVSSKKIDRCKLYDRVVP